MMMGRINAVADTSLEVAVLPTASLAATVKAAFCLSEKDTGKCSSVVVESSVPSLLMPYCIASDTALHERAALVVAMRHGSPPSIVREYAHSAIEIVGVPGGVVSTIIERARVVVAFALPSNALNETTFVPSGSTSV